MRVYNGSTIILSDDLSAVFFGLKYIKTIRKSYAFSRNIGLKKAVGDILFIIDDDCFIGSGAINKIINCHKKYPSIPEVF